MENNNELELKQWADSILEKWTEIPAGQDYLSLLLTILNYEDEEPLESNFEEIKNNCEDFLAINEEQIDDDNITQISIIYYGNISSNQNELDELILKANNYVNENIKNIDLYEENVVLVIFSSKEIKENTRRTLLNHLKKNGTKITDIKSVIFSDMKKTYENNKNKKPYVSEFKFDLDEGNNILEFESNDVLSFVANISAKSIKAVYEQYGKNCGPLYGSNLRYHINNKKIDDDIRYSIKHQSKEFWFRNNGIVIVCDDMEVKGNELTIKNFSFVNGGQTSYMIGETEFFEDFYILVKIISTKNLDPKNKLEFTFKIGESTNKQKPINEADLKANKPKTKILESTFKNLKPFLNLNSRRGAKIPDDLKKKSEKWRNLSLVEVGQLGLSFILFSPGSAKSSKKAIWNDDNFEVIFNKEYAELYSNLRKIWFLLNEFRSNKYAELKRMDKTNSFIQYYSTGQWIIFNTLLVCELIRKNDKFKELIREENEFNKWQNNLKSFLIEESKNKDFLKIRNSNIIENLEDIVPELISDFIKPTFLNSFYSKSGTFANYSKTDKHFQGVTKAIIEEYDKKSKFNEDIENLLNALFE